MSLKFIFMSSRLHNWHCTWISQRQLKFYITNTRIIIFLSYVVLLKGCLALLWFPLATTRQEAESWEPSLTPSFLSTVPDQSPIFYWFCFLNVSPIHLLFIISADYVLIQLLISLLDSSHSYPGLLSPFLPSSNPSSLLQPGQLRQMRSP